MKATTKQRVMQAHLRKLEKQATEYAEASAAAYREGYVLAYCEHGIYQFGESDIPCIACECGYTVLKASVRLRRAVELGRIFDKAVSDLVDTTVRLKKAGLLQYFDHVQAAKDLRDQFGLTDLEPID